MYTFAPLNLFINPSLIWGRLAWKSGEMAMASAQVIGERSLRLALAGPNPGINDQREVSLMVREKGEAALESAQATFVRMMMMGQQFSTLAFKQALSVSAMLSSLATSRPSAESAGRQVKLIGKTMAGSAAAASKISASTARLASSALKPIHKRVRGNARRLAKR